MSHHRPWARSWWAASKLVLPFLVILAWLPAISAPYHYDDFNTPVGDPASQSLSAWWRAMPQTLRPLTKLTYALESSLGAVDAPSRRLLNAILFGVCIALVRSLVRSVGASPIVAMAVAAIWALHPVHAETIVALAGRPVLLCLCLTLGSALLLLRDRPWWALVCAVLAVAARESGLPWLVACTVLCGRQMGASRRQLMSLAAAASAFGLAAVLSVDTLRHLVTTSLGAAGAVNRLGLQWAALFRGTLGLFLDPASFTLDMDFAPAGARRLTMILGALGLYSLALWLALRERRWRSKDPHPNDAAVNAVRVTALLWVCLVVPTHSLIPKVDPFTARPFSASLAPLLALATYAGLAGLRHLASRYPDARARVTTQAALAAGACLTIAYFVHTTRIRATLYQDPVALWSDAAERSTTKTRPLVNLAALLANRGQLQQAEAALESAITRDSGSLDTRARLGALRRLRNLGEGGSP